MKSKFQATALLLAMLPALQDIRFSARSHTKKKVANKSGNMPVLLDGVDQVTAGVARIMQLRQLGYACIRP